MYSEEELALIKTHLEAKFAFCTASEAEEHLKEYSFFTHYPAGFEEWWSEKKDLLERKIAAHKAVQELERHSATIDKEDPCVADEVAVAVCKKCGLSDFCGICGDCLKCEGGGNARCNACDD
ncbi:hypothetical protein C0580_02975 [Candidatus Parcubacteria bacterium]|nr:MAG: hypothetical protein C0580_02975 [Candidatus Parcubacteria bacterium]